MSRTREIRTALYALKQQYGFRLGVYYRNPDTVNLQTGVMNVTETVYQVRRAIVLPSSLFAKLFRHFGTVAFNYGSDLDIERRVFIIDKKDIRGVNIINTEQWYIVYNHKRYSMEKIESFDYDDCYFITGKELTGTQVMEQYSVQIHDWLFIKDGFVYAETLTDSIVFTDTCLRSLNYANES